LTEPLDFAAWKHTVQQRKGEAHEPYINHLAEATGGKDLNLVIAGLLHETIEEAKTTNEELVEEYDADVTGLVPECRMTSP